MAIEDGTADNTGSELFDLEVTGGTYTVNTTTGSFAASKIYRPNGELLLTYEPDGVLNVDRRMAYVDSSGNKVFDVSGQQKVNKTGGDYALVEPDTEEAQIVLSQNFSLSKSKWEISDANGRTIATAASQSMPFGLLRNKPIFRRVIPCEYTIKTPDGSRVGTIMNGWMSSTYSVTIQEDAPVKLALLLTGMAVHKLEVRK